MTNSFGYNEWEFHQDLKRECTPLKVWTLWKGFLANYAYFAYLIRNHSILLLQSPFGWSSHKNSLKESPKNHQLPSSGFLSLFLEFLAVFLGPILVNSLPKTQLCFGYFVCVCLPTVQYWSCQTIWASFLYFLSKLCW